jgi:hypothetical protein
MDGFSKESWPSSWANEVSFSIKNIPGFHLFLSSVNPDLHHENLRFNRGSLKLQRCDVLLQPLLFKKSSFYRGLFLNILLALTCCAFYALFFSIDSTLANRSLLFKRFALPIRCPKRLRTKSSQLPK